MLEESKTVTFDRRRFLKTAAVGAAAIYLGGLSRAATAQAADAFTLPKLPWAPNALEPVISAKTIGFHYGKHHAGYVANLNKMLAGSKMAKMPLEGIIKATAGKKDQAGVFNNAAQVWNHTFYWNSMKPGGGGQPGGALAAKIKSDLGGYDKFAQAFAGAAGSQFGAGWAWLVLRDGKLAVMKTPNAVNPLVMGAKPLLTIDVWEHAYYLDWQNRRGDYVKAWLGKLVNWDFAAKNLAM